MVLTFAAFEMIHLQFEKDQTQQSCEITTNIRETWSRFVASLHGCTLCARVRSSDFLKQSLLKIISFSFHFIWLIMSPKRTYAEVISGVEYSPDDGQRWMRAYQQENKEEALKKAIQFGKV